MDTQDFLKSKLEEIKTELNTVKAKLGNRAGEFVDDLEAKIENTMAEVDKELDEEVAEFKQLGLIGWVKANPKATATMVALAVVAVNGVLALFGLHFGL
jgi:tetrahydromethanopterin S-methyltransferase subunit G